MLVDSYQKTLRSLFITSASLLMCSAALANPTIWQGPYVGAYFGGALGNNHVSSNAGSITSNSYLTTTADVNAVSNAGTWTDTDGELIGGIVAGHDWIWKKWVYGAAVDFGGFPLTSTNTISNVYSDNSGTYNVYTSIYTSWLFTLRARLGYQTTLRWPSLLYLTGGLALTKLNVSNSYSDNSALSGVGGNNTHQNQLGWTLGAGIEILTLKHFTLDFDYMYVRFPSVKTTATIANSADGFGVPVNSLTNPLTTKGSLYSSMFRLGLNYRFEE